MAAKTKTHPQPTLLILGILVFIALAFAGHSASESTSLLFVQTAPSGSLSPINSSEGAYSLTLNNADPEVMFYANRPAVDVGTMSTQDLFDFLFEPGLAPPNGAIVLDQGAGQPQLTFGFQFEDGLIDANGNVVYTVRRLDSLTGTLSALETDELAGLPVELDDIDLFLDSGSVNRCQVHLWNATSEELDLASLDPDSGSWNWAQHPYQTVNANSGSAWGTTIWTYRYKGTSDNATVTYNIDDKTTLEVDLHCRADGGTSTSSCHINGTNVSKYYCGDNRGVGVNSSNFTVNLKQH